jgi:hypothetical protein
MRQAPLERWGESLLRLNDLRVRGGRLTWRRWREMLIGETRAKNTERCVEGCQCEPLSLSALHERKDFLTKAQYLLRTHRRREFLKLSHSPTLQLLLP